MDSSVDDLVHIDDSIKSMHEFIIEGGEEPVERDACTGKAYTSNKFGDLAEQYVRCLFKETGITKLAECQKPSPDFKILIMERSFYSKSRLSVICIKTSSDCFARLLKRKAIRPSQGRRLFFLRAIISELLLSRFTEKTNGNSKSG